MTSPLPSALAFACLLGSAFALTDADITPVALAGKTLTFTMGAPAPKGSEIGIRQGDHELIDGKSKTDFGFVQVSKTSLAKKFTITNTGTTPLKNLGFSVTGGERKEFILSTPKIRQIAPGQHVDFSIMFKPKTFGNRRALLHIMSNDRDKSSFDIKLVGEGVGIK